MRTEECTGSSVTVRDGISTVRAGIPWQRDDGGRDAAGYRGVTGDCAVRAIAIATQMPYQEAYDLVNEHGLQERQSKKRKARSSARTGVYGPTMRRIMASLGWAWTPTMKVGQGCRVHLAVGELPPGRIVVNLSKHFAAVIDGVLHDTYADTRGGTRCVYGYWSAP